MKRGEKTPIILKPAAGDARAPEQRPHDPGINSQFALRKSAESVQKQWPIRKLLRSERRLSRFVSSSHFQESPYQIGFHSRVSCHESYEGALCL